MFSRGASTACSASGTKRSARERRSFIGIEPKYATHRIGEWLRNFPIQSAERWLRGTKTVELTRRTPLEPATFPNLVQNIGRYRTVHGRPATRDTNERQLSSIHRPCHSHSTGAGEWPEDDSNCPCLVCKPHPLGGVEARAQSRPVARNQHQELHANARELLS